MKIVDHMLAHDDGTPMPFRESPNWTHDVFLAPEYLVMHFTAGRSAAGSVDWFLDPGARASAHLVVGRDGAITQLVRFDRVAWHVGASRCRPRRGWSASPSAARGGRWTCSTW
jgi:N-acetylmuramoyl-L-alanine amidase